MSLTLRITLSLALAPALACTGDDSATASASEGSSTSETGTSETSAGSTATTTSTTTAATTTTAGTTTDATTASTTDATTASTTDATTTTAGTTTGDPVACDPQNLPAEGAPCENDGEYCSPGCEDPCEFCNVVQCVDGTWQGLEVFPADCLSCDDICPPVLAAACKGGPPDMMACVTGCQANEENCGLVYHKVLACVGTEPTFTCEEDSSLPTVARCQAEFDALYACLGL